MMKHVLAVLTGVVVGGLSIALLESVSHDWFPLPQALVGADFTVPENMAALRAHIATLPPMAFAMVLMAWFVGALDGALLAAWLAPSRPHWMGGLVGGLLALAAAGNLLAFPHPQWMMWATPLVFLVATGLGVWLGARLQARRVAGQSGSTRAGDTRA